jgi:hypothetical protein
MIPAAKTLLEQRGKPVWLVPCTVTQTSPLLVTLLGETNIPAVSIAGASYSLGAANALMTSPGKPIILPIGP